MVMAQTAIKDARNHKSVQYGDILARSKEGIVHELGKMDDDI